MNQKFKKDYKKYFIVAFLIMAFVLVCFLFYSKASKAEIEKQEINLNSEFVTIQENTLLPLSSMPQTEIKVVKTMRVLTTAYSSTVCQTDDTPFITASGTYVKDGIVANNLLSFGTKIRIPEIYGDKIFIVEDRMHWKKGYYHVDIWFSSYWGAKTFGVKNTYIEVIKEI
ncbi:MAG: hypothetical protein WBC21_02300 [Minisyncoccales bacterium]